MAVATQRTAFLEQLDSFGDVAAENEGALLNYFLETDAVSSIASARKFLVLGRKGSGKTALVRYFSESSNAGRLSRPINLRDYPWNIHAARKDSGASDVEAYVASWRYLIAISLATLVLERIADASGRDADALRRFLLDNYGGITPDLRHIIRPKALRLSNLTFAPRLFGVEIGSIDFERNDANLGFELNALTDMILKAVINVLQANDERTLLLQFDELDQGLIDFDTQRQNMLIGLVLAADQVRKFAERESVSVTVNPVIYFRSDLWRCLHFSDKNKITQSQALHLEWDTDTLMQLVNRRLQAKLGVDACWEDIEDGDRMASNQTKWDHIVKRTFLRPRDVIQFLNVALRTTKDRLMHGKRKTRRVTNKDITNAREGYSQYLQKELDDEIRPHWQSWERCVGIFSAIQTESFTLSTFQREYKKRRESDGPEPIEVLRRLYEFSVIGYERRSGYGGTSWMFHYTHPESQWDAAATKFKVHPGLKEYAKLREKRERHAA